MARLASLLLLGATAASAHAGHGHAHAHKHKRADGDQICATIDGAYVCWTQEGDYYDGTSTSSAAATTTAAAAIDVNVNVAATSAATTFATSTTSASTAASTGSTSSSSSSSSIDTTGYFVSTYTAFDDISCISSRATKEQIAQVGNTGGTCYGSNFLVITDADVAEQYDNTVSFSNATEAMTCYYWNKATSSGTIAGWYTSTDSYFTFALAAGATVYLAAEAGTEGAASCFPDSTGLLTDANSAILGTWTEFDFVDDTTGWSAADISSIMAQDGDSTVYGVEVCTLDGATCSSIGADMSSLTNAFSAAEAALDGLGINLEGSMKIAVNLGF